MKTPAVNNTSRLTRPPLERMLRIHQAIQSGAYPNARSLALDLEVSSKSIQRDIEFMRDRFELPIEYDATRYGYYYTEEVSAFPTFQISEGELFALLVAEKALQQYRGTSFEKPLVSAFRKMAESLPDTVSLHLSDWDEAISFRTSAMPILDLESFDRLAKATAQRKQIEIQYRKPGSKTAEPRTVDPYHLANINGEWFLFAYDHLRKDLRTFAPTRIQSIEFTGRTFQRTEKFSLEHRLRNSFGIHSGKGEYRVVIRFTSFAADYIREKQWHSTQKLKDLAGGELELSMTLSSLAEVERWILSWGGQARAIEPAELVSSIAKAAGRLAETHAE